MTVPRSVIALGLGYLVACSGAPSSRDAGLDAATDASPPDSTPETCASVLGRYEALLSDALACTSEIGCAATQDLPPQLPFCGRAVLRADTDERELAEIAERWVALGCRVEGTCPTAPERSVPACIDGRCTVIPPCALCPTDIEPVCTASDQNATNACVAAECLGEGVVTEGPCADTAECIALGGTCEEQLPGRSGSVAPCPAGTRFDATLFSTLCAGGTYRTVCCIPWDEPCPYLAWTLDLSLDPFTCRPAPGRGNVCIQPVGEVVECTGAAWEYFEPLAAPDADVTLEMDVTSEGDGGASVVLTGTRTGSERRFRCTGPVQWDPLSDDRSTWYCEACDRDTCNVCAIQQAVSCRL